ncbi:MAG: nuclear transport factor 2 family protein [Novosphingobium sp.]
MNTPVTQIMAELADREAIRECLYRYSRGVDRLDADMVRSAYWPDCDDQHLDFRGNAEEFIAWAFPLMGLMDQTMHMIGNVLMAIEDDRASVESYFYGYHRVTIDGVKQDVIGAGRYLDRFEKRGEEWRIAERLVMTDWFRHYPDSADWQAGLMGMQCPMGKRMPDDPSYRMNGPKLI